MSIEQLLESWPIACDRPFVAGTAIYDTRQYLSAAPIFEQNGFSLTPTQQYRTVAPTPGLEMKRWIQIVEEGLKKKPNQQILTEPSTFNALAKNESVLREVDPITTRQNVDMIQDVSTNVDSQIPVDNIVRDQLTRQVHSEARSQEFWHEIDPKTGKAVDPEKDKHPLNGEMAGWKIL